MENKQPYSVYKKAKNYKKKWVTIKAESKSVILIIIGIVSASFGLNGFLLPNKFIDGGITGISLLLTEITHLPLSILLVVINIPFIFLGYVTLGKQLLGLDFALPSYIIHTSRMTNYWYLFLVEYF